MKNKRFYLLVMLLVIFFSLSGSVSFASSQSSELMLKYKIIKGVDESNNLKLDSFFTVEQFAVVLTKIGKLELSESQEGLSYFNDANTISAWAKPYLNACVLNQVFSPAYSGSIASGGGVTGNQLAFAMLATLGYRNILPKDAEEILKIYNIRIENKILTRGEAFDLIWQFLTKPVCSDGSYLLEKNGIDTIDNLTKQGYEIDERVPYKKVLSLIDKANNSLNPEVSIMHAAGRIHGLSLPNTKEAILMNYERGKRIFEIDFLKTSDGKYIGLHHWTQVDTPLFENAGQGLNYKGEPLSASEFNKLKFYKNMSRIDFDVLEELIKDKPDIQIVTDTKDDNLELLKCLVSNYPNLTDNIIPQVYDRSEYAQAVNMGFKKIIYTLYRSKDTGKDVLNFIEQVHPYAITMNWERLSSKEWKEILKKETNVFVHNVNSLKQAEYLLRMGVDGIYTDDL